MGHNNGAAELITLGKAVDLLGVSRSTLWRIIREHNIETYPGVLDKRSKLVRRNAIEELLAAATNGSESTRSQH